MIEIRNCQEVQEEILSHNDKQQSNKTRTS